ncbi:histidine kinase 1-like [Mangifera indica]|uniref:histidine kinase 1-like n=1 Tax=Mangifera indica TaxID=29780 RepID=UPI001CFB1737|nr:histidine kinase 1-like [Mangifera indica]
MPEKALQIQPITNSSTTTTPTSGTSPTSGSPMATPLTRTPCRKALHRLTAFTRSLSWRRKKAPRGRRNMCRADQQADDFQQAGSHCLTSYYSVFVVRLAIMIMLAILIGMLTVLTWHFTKVYTTKSLDTLAYGLRYELLQRPILRMWNILNSTSEITMAQVKLSEYVLRKYSNSVTQANPTSQAQLVELYETMKAVTWSLFQSRKALNAITINYRNGFVQAFHRDHRSNRTFYIYSDLSNYSISAGGLCDSNKYSSQGWNDQSIKGNISAIWYREPLDPNTGNKIGKARPIPPDDLINIAGLSQVPDGAASWHVAVSKFTDSPLLSAALPVFGPSNQSIVAVVGVTTALSSVGQLMKELVEVHSGHIYLTSQEGYLLATSTNAPLLSNTSTKPELVMAVDSQDDVIRKGARWLQTIYGNKFPSGQVVHIEHAKLGKEDFYIDSFFLNLKRLPIVGVIIIPREYIMGKADQRAFKTLIILISASVCILIIGCLCILILTNGVSKEMKLRAELISHLEARRRAEASNNYKSQFLANMSHELRTPMAAIIGLLDILITDSSLASEHYASLTQIRKCSLALLRLLNNILDLSKVEAGKLVLEEADFNLGQELEGIVDMHSVQCINQDVELVLDLSDDMPETFRGDSARFVQIFSNLMSNSIKFTKSGYVIVRGWCETWSSFEDSGKSLLEQKKSWCALKSKFKQQAIQAKKTCKKENKMILWFEIEDTGCGIDPSKWETVFESFEQADASTTRKHGGTGLGLSIVRTLVRKMGGEVKVVKKDTPGTLMRLYLLLNTPSNGSEQSCQVEFSKPTVVVLALGSRVGRGIMSQWLCRNKVSTIEASDWKQLTLILSEFFNPTNESNGWEEQPSLSQAEKKEILNIKAMKDQVFIIVVDVGLLDFKSGIWLSQLDQLDQFTRKAKFAWTLSHNSSSMVKAELRKRGHVIVVNKPLYKTKMIQILEAALQGRTLEIDSCSPDKGASKSKTLVDCDIADALVPLSLGDKIERLINPRPTQHHTFMKHPFEFTDQHPEPTNSSTDSEHQSESSLESLDNSKGKEIASTSEESPKSQKQKLVSSPPKDKCSSSSSGSDEEKLRGLHILVVEDTLLLQMVAVKILLKAGAKVNAVSDGLQAVEAMTSMINSLVRRNEALKKGLEPEPLKNPPYDLILMDCQMPVMDGYEATKEIRKMEEGTGLHIQIIAQTAHAMSTDRDKCLEVGMDGYLTKPLQDKITVESIMKHLGMSTD